MSGIIPNWTASVVQPLFSPRPERAELSASPPLPWALWWSERWGLHSQRHGWRFSWPCRRNVEWTKSPHNYQQLDSPLLSWRSCCFRQGCPEFKKKKSQEAVKIDFHDKLQKNNPNRTWVKPSVARWALSLCKAQTWPSPFLQTDQPKQKSHILMWWET